MFCGASSFVSKPGLKQAIESVHAQNFTENYLDRIWDKTHVDLTIATSIDNNPIPQIAQKIPMTVPELALGLKFCQNIAIAMYLPILKFCRYPC